MNVHIEPITARIQWLSDRANKVVEGVLVVIALAITMITGLQVFSRYVLNHSLFWSEEVGRILLVWISFLGATAAYKRRAHIGIDFLASRLALRAQRLVKTAVLVLSLAFFAVLITYGSAFALFVLGQKTAALHVPVSAAYLVIPASGALFFLHGLDQLLSLLWKDQG